MATTGVSPLNELHKLRRHFNDHGDIILLSQSCYHYDQLKAMIHQDESAVYQCYDYLAAYESELECNEDSICEECRMLMCRWCYQVANISNYRSETAAHAISYLDRYLCTTQGKPALFNTTLFQLSAMTALYVAIKNHEYLEMKKASNNLIKKFVSFSQGTFCAHDFVKCEKQILAALKWRLNGPTPHSFIECYLSLLPKEYHEEIIVKYDIRNIARSLVDEVICNDYSSWITSLSSDIGLAVLLNALSTCEIKIKKDNDRSSFLILEIRNSLLSLSAMKDKDKFVPSSSTTTSSAPHNHEEEDNDTTTTDVLSPFCHLSLENVPKQEVMQKRRKFVSGKNADKQMLLKQ